MHYTIAAIIDGLRIADQAIDDTYHARIPSDDAAIAEFQEHAGLYWSYACMRLDAILHYVDASMAATHNPSPSIATHRAVQRTVEPPIGESWLEFAIGRIRASSELLKAMSEMSSSFECQWQADSPIMAELIERYRESKLSEGQSSDVIKCLIREASCRVEAYTIER